MQLLLHLIFALCFTQGIFANSDFYTIRLVQMDEEEKLYHFICQCYGYGNETPHLTRENFHRYGFTERPYFYAEIAEAENEIVGYAIYFYSFCTDTGSLLLYIDDLYVKSDARGQGIGTALLMELNEHAKEHSCAWMEWHVPAWNKKAITFYKNLGASWERHLFLMKLENPAFENIAQN